MQCHITQLDRATSTCHGAMSTCHGTMSTCCGATACAKQEFKLDTFWNPVRPLETAPTSNVHNFHIQSTLEVHKYLTESLFCPLSNGSSLTSKFLLCTSESPEEDVISPVWANLGLVIVLNLAYMPAGHLRGVYCSHKQ